MAARHLGAAKYISMEKFDVNILSEQLSDLFLKPSVSPDQIIEEEGK
ncbi:MAG: hypothetical protein IPL73_09855 [Candidatus Obscuribacter sp.]|nr:hypothetical protein [Candidatus Obscuribacter sp.]